MIKFSLFLTGVLFLCNCQLTGQAAMKEFMVKKCADFNITGNGENAAWNRTSWTMLTRLDPGNDYESKFKILYSATGIYVLFNGADKKITTTYLNDFEDLFKADVFEVFFHPDTSIPLYLEYEINQLGKELVLLIPNLDGRVNGWLPWHYENTRRTSKMVKVVGGKAEPGAAITSWSAEIFLPYSLFNPLGSVPPVSGTIWNANFYRLDYDSGSMVKWAWAPVEKSFHDFKKFQPIRFE